MKENSFSHDIEHLTTESAVEICKIIIEYFNPNSVVDFGCGLGAFLYTFKKYGVKDVLGINGEWVKYKDVEPFLKRSEFKNLSLINEIVLDKNYDIVLCLEVAEHIDEKYAGTIISNLTKAGNIVVFSAAIPGQLGQNHINEQWPTYWIEKFNIYNYKPLDIIRPVIWSDTKIKTWYKQNILIFVPNNFIKNDLPNVNNIYNKVHPELFNYRHTYLTNQLKEKIQSLENIKDGKLRIVFYIKLLIKSIFQKF